MSAEQRVGMLVRLLPPAVGLNETGGEHLDVDGVMSSEYLRGQAELICEAAGITTDHKVTLMLLIADLAGAMRAEE